MPTGAQYATLQIKIGLAQENGFSPAFVLRLVKSAAKLCTC
jgi:hypothetical protein